MNLTHLFTTYASVDAHNNALYTLSRNNSNQSCDIIFGDTVDDFKISKSNFPDDPTSLNTLIII